MKKFNVKKIFLLITVVISNIRLLFKKFFLFKKIKYNVRCIIEKNVNFVTKNGGKILIKKDSRIRSGTEISSNGGMIILEGNNFINRNCMIVSHKKITIGYGTTIGPNVLIYDHDHNIYKNDINDDDFISKEIVIGNNVWIGSGTIILKGVKIGDNSVIGAGSVITKDIPQNKVVVQTREMLERDIVNRNSNEKK